MEEMFEEEMCEAVAKVTEHAKKIMQAMIGDVVEGLASGPFLDEQATEFLGNDRGSPMQRSRWRRRIRSEDMWRAGSPFRRMQAPAAGSHHYDDKFDFEFAEIAQDAREALTRS